MFCFAFKIKRFGRSFFSLSFVQINQGKDSGKRKSIPANEEVPKYFLACLLATVRRTCCRGKEEISCYRQNIGQELRKLLYLTRAHKHIYVCVYNILISKASVSACLHTSQETHDPLSNMHRSKAN